MPSTPRPGPLSWVRRGAAYLAVLVVGVVVAFGAGVVWFTRTECAGPEDGECDLAGLGGMVFAAVTVVVLVAGMVVLEVVRARRRRPSVWRGQ